MTVEDDFGNNVL